MDSEYNIECILPNLAIIKLEWCLVKKKKKKKREWWIIIG